MGSIMSIGDCYAVKLFQDFDGQQLLNVWTYEQVAGGSNQADALRDAFESTVLAEIAALQVTTIDYTNLEVFNIEFGSDYADGAPTPGSGLRTADTLLPKFVALGMRSNRDGYGSRRSFKRFGGFNEADTLSATTWQSSIMGLADTLAAAMQGNLSDGTNTFKPIQLLSGWSPGSVPNKNFDITSWTAVNRITSQVSRRG